MITRSPSLPRAALLATLLYACGGPSGSSNAGDGGRRAACTVGGDPCDARSLGSRVFVSESDYTSGRLGSIGTRDRCAAVAIAPLSGDAVLAWHGSLLVALNYGMMNGEDNVTYFDVSASPPCLVGQIPMQREGETGGGNARGYLALDATRALVARFNQATVAVVDVARQAIVGTIDLAPYRAAAPHPRPRDIARVGTHAWVTLGRLAADLLQPPPSPGAIAVIDPATHSVARVIELRFANPVGRMAVRGGRVVLPCVGTYQTVGDGAVEELDAPSMQPARTLVTEADVGGNIDAVVPLDDDRLLLRVVARAVGDALAVENTRLMVWSIAQRRASNWLTVANYALTEPILGRDGRVYVGDRGDEATRRPHGVRVFDAATGEELTRASGPIGLGLQPYDLIEEPARP
jgi:hypothetical protein